MAWQQFQQQFYDFFWPHALTASQSTGISPEVIFAQAALESSWGRSAPGNNYFGIKGAGGNQTTQEYINGKWVTITDSFRRYTSPADSALDWANFLGKYKRYDPVFSAQGATAQATALGKSGYATDPGYGGKLLSIIRGLPQNTGLPSLPKLPDFDWSSPYSLGKSIGDAMGAPDIAPDLGGKISETIDGILSKIADPLKRAGFVVVAVVIIAAALFLMAGKPVVSQGA